MTIHVLENLQLKMIQLKIIDMDKILLVIADIFSQLISSEKLTHFYNSYCIAGASIAS